MQGHDHPWLLARTLDAQAVHWIAGTAPPDVSAGGAVTLGAKTRYRQSDAHCRLFAQASDGFSLAFDEPQWAVTPGQSAVLYQAEVCLGGGIIHAAQA